MADLSGTAVAFGQARPPMPGDRASKRADLLLVQVVLDLIETQVELLTNHDVVGVRVDELVPAEVVEVRVANPRLMQREPWLRARRRSRSSRALSTVSSGMAPLSA